MVELVEFECCCYYVLAILDTSDCIALTTGWFNILLT